MIEPRELNDYLSGFETALSGRMSHRREIVAELRSHLLDELDADPAGAGAAPGAIARFGSVEEIASGFNALLRRRRLRVLRSVLALALVSAAAGASVERSLAPTNPPSRFASLLRLHPMIMIVPGKPNAGVIDVKTGKPVAYFRRI